VPARWLKGDAQLAEEKGKKTMLLGIGILLIAIALGAAGQIFLKVGVNTLGDKPPPLQIIKSIVTVPAVFLGFFCYATSSLFYLVALSKLDLSYAYPMIALSYVAVVLLSWQYLGENVSALRIAGLAVIIVGVVLVGLSAPRSEAPPTDEPATIERPADPMSG
jgi:drug/metabolite transporter (DMT)-like permease